MEKPLIIICCYMTCVLALILTIGGFAVNDFKDNNYKVVGKSSDQLAGLYDLARDWQKSPFLELSITKDYGCEGDWEPVFERIFYGAKPACDCLGISHRYIEDDNKFNNGQVCSTNQTRFGCRQAQPFPPIRMNRVVGRHICGKPSGVPFVEANRPQRKRDGSYACLPGQLPCVANAKPEDTVCYEEAKGYDSQCPITDIRFITAEERNSTTYLSEEWTVLNEELSFDPPLYLAYSKSQANLPLTSFKIGPQPCKNPSSQASQNSHYPTEVMQDVECQEGLDARYSDSGMFVDMRELYDEYNINSFLTSQPSFGIYSQVPDKLGYKTWQRSTVPWKIECESRGKSRHLAVKKASIVIFDSGHTHHVYNCGIAICVIYSIFACCCCVFTFIGKDLDKMLVLNSGIFCVCSRLVWLIIAPIMLTSLGEMRKAAEKNIEISDDFEIVNECADEYAKVNQDALRAIQEDHLDTIWNVNTMTIAAFLVFGVELLLSLCLCCCSLGYRRTQGNYSWKEEFKSFNQAYFSIGN